MDSRTRYSPPDPSPYDEFDRYFDTELAAGERINPLPPRRSRIFSRVLLVLVLALGGGWYYWGDASMVSRWLPPEVAAQLQAAIDKLTAATSGLLASSSRQTEPSPAPAQIANAVEPPPSSPVVAPMTPDVQSPPASPVASAPAADAPAKVEIVAKAESEPEPEQPDLAAKAEPEAPPERLPPPIIDQSDPYQRKATAVGLHPELSRAVLERLTAADYRNAGVAIKKALAKTPDTEVLVWPRERKAGLALFQVKFVAGAPADCRRYVVAIVLDRWQTTALPMERCDVKPVRAAARVSPALDKVRSSAP